MKKPLFWIVAFVFLFSLNVNAQLLWKITGSDSTKTSYLFGTHHLIEKNKIKGLAQVLAVSIQTDVVIGEVNVLDKTLEATVMQNAVMTGTTIKGLLTPENYAFIDREFKLLLGVGLSQMGNMKPIMLDNIFQIANYLKQNNITKQPEPIDMFFQVNATAGRKAVIGLETADDQVNILFNSFSLERQAEILVKDVRDKLKGIDEMKRMNELYLAGDLAGLEALSKENDSMTPEENKSILDVRNNNWMKKLPALIDQKSCFIAVGCLHLVGETGLIRQLQLAGYTVKPVELK